VRKPGWMKSQIEDAKAETRNWPQWLRRARGLEDAESSQPQPEKERVGTEPAVREPSE
jgi:hypothetical protein